MSLAHVLLAMMIGNSSPGKSLYSFEPVAECGTDPEVAACELKRACETTGPLCSPPRWSKARGAWVRVESRETAIRRFSRMMAILAQVSSRLVHCHNGDGVVDESCKPAGWPGSATQLAIVGLTTLIHESGGREDILEGHPPVGRGKMGEVCIMQLMPQYTPPYASWLTSEQKEQLKNAGFRARKKWAEGELLGEKNLGKCLEIGLRQLAATRRGCRGSGFEWSYAMWSRYGTGNSCNAGKFAHGRTGTFHRLWGARKRYSLSDDDLGILGLSKRTDEKSAP